MFSNLALLPPSDRRPAHHDLYEKAGILHRDISINSLMVHPEEPEKGVLINFDMAAQDKDPNTGARIDLPPMQGGTLPFRAVDLCCEDPLPRSLYRHDLEGFFFVLLWMLLYRSGRSVDECFAPWSAGDWTSIYNDKKRFLYGGGDDRFSGYLPLNDSWVEPLRSAFNRGYSARAQHSGTLSEPPLSPSDEDTLDNHITYEIFIGILKGTSRSS